MKGRRVATAVAAVLGALVVGLAGAWACTSSSGPYISDLVPDRSPAGTTVAVKGEGWSSASAVSLAWLAKETGVVEPLKPVTTTDGGAFELQAPVPRGPAGVFFLVATQGGVERRMPFELAAPATRAEAASPLAADDNGARALQDIDAQDASRSSGSVPLLIPLAAGLGVVAMAGVGVAEVRRRRATVTSAS